MNLGRARIALRPRSLGETFDLAFRWMFAIGGRTCAWLVLLLLVPPALLAYAAHHAFVEIEWLDVWLFAIPLALALQAPFTIAASQQMFDPHTTVGSVMKRLAVNLGRLFAAGIVRNALLLVSSGLASPWLVFLREATLLEGNPVLPRFAAVRRSAAFMSRRVLGLMAGQAVALFAFVIAFDAFGGVLFEFGLALGHPFGDLWEDGGSLFALLGLFAAAPYLATVRFLDYVDARTRRDGWDVQLVFLAIVVAANAADDEEDAA